MSDTDTVTPADPKVQAYLAELREVLAPGKAVHDHAERLAGWIVRTAEAERTTRPAFKTTPEDVAACLGRMAAAVELVRAEFGGDLADTFRARK